MKALYELIQEADHLVIEEALVQSEQITERLVQIGEKLLERLQRTEFVLRRSAVQVEKAAEFAEQCARICQRLGGLIAEAKQTVKKRRSLDGRHLPV